MAYLTISASPSLVESHIRFSGLEAGEALSRGAACYISSDGKVYQTVCVSGTTGSAVEFDGIVLKATPISTNCTLFGVGSRLNLSTGMTIGTRYWSGSAGNSGGLTSASYTNAEAEPICKAVSATDVIVIRKY